MIFFILCNHILFHPIKPKEEDPKKRAKVFLIYFSWYYVCIHRETKKIVLVAAKEWFITSECSFRHYPVLGSTHPSPPEQFADHTLLLSDGLKKMYIKNPVKFLLHTVSKILLLKLKIWEKVFYLQYSMKIWTCFQFNAKRQLYCGNWKSFC